MANLKRHFNFSGKSSQERELSFSLSDKFFSQQCDKNNLMSDICNCLDLCCAYIQALNALCGAGSCLAQSIFRAVRDVPSLQGASLHFLSIWEEVGTATAGASAAVKTETLMRLQEALNALEMGKDDAEHTVTESFQVIGTCLSSFIELQAQFSLNTWKALSKLSKYFTNDSMRHTLQWKSLERSPSKITVNSELNGTIKKHFSHFSKVGIQKFNETSDSRFTPPLNQGMCNVPVYSSFENQNMAVADKEDSIWSSPTSVWSSVSATDMSFLNQSQSSEQDSQSVSSVGSDLDEVINLLSCVPVQQSSPSRNYTQFGKEQMYHLLPRATRVPISSQRSWPMQGKEQRLNCEPLASDRWLWRLDNMNCSELPFNTSESSSNRDLHWEYKELLRKQSSGDSLPGCLENISESKEEYLWTTQSKINTWPLKQPISRASEAEYPEYSGSPIQHALS
ncbi:hypothetical protein JTE90_008314 [Oedothorax gibbosus]|uniref:DUF4745 domain-containing protein n=1 Tax=Oedothorax gibbosus TaxID=931172 RepID=A0AAV6TUC5_9ARAC|nr:hypothetical protein JTE90_008314 [Oedothorax gibbosus]